MINFNRFLFYGLLIIILSFESTIALPVFSLFLFFKYLDRFNPADESSFWRIFLILFLMAFALAVFYQFSLSLSIVLLFIYYLLRTSFGNRFFSKSRRQWQALQLTLFILLQLLIFILAGLSFNVFLLLQMILAVVLFLVKTSTIGRL